MVEAENRFLEDFADPLRRTGDDGALVRNHNGPFDQDRVLRHGIQHRFVVAWIEADFLDDRLALADRFGRADARLGQHRFDFGAVGRGLEIFDQLDLNPRRGFEDRQRGPRFRAAGIVPDGRLRHAITFTGPRPSPANLPAT